jgi:hypothetical protein
VCIGIIPCTNESDRATPKAGYPNEYVEIAIYTHLPYSGDRGTEDLSRNHINVLSGSAIVALPGEAGTVSELVLAVRYGKPVIAFSHSPALIRGFPSAVRQVERIELVTQFLQQHIGV